MEKTEKNPSSYTDSLPAESREALSRLDALISTVMAGHSRALWVGPFHISLYVNAVQNGRYVSESFGPTLGKVKVGKASISFKRGEAAPAAPALSCTGRGRSDGQGATRLRARVSVQGGGHASGTSHPRGPCGLSRPPPLVGVPHCGPGLSP